MPLVPLSLPRLVEVAQLGPSQWVAQVDTGRCCLAPFVAESAWLALDRATRSSLGPILVLPETLAWFTARA